VYSNGVSETLIGKAIKKYDIPREKLVILTKVYAGVGEQQDVRTAAFSKELRVHKDYVNQAGMSCSSHYFRESRISTPTLEENACILLL
jgi:aryl-alcohol dehydrogenase-like predicted oxidoreductase